MSNKPVSDKPTVTTDRMQTDYIDLFLKNRKTFQERLSDWHEYDQKKICGNIHPDVKHDSWERMWHVSLEGAAETSEEKRIARTRKAQWESEQESMREERAAEHRRREANANFKEGAPLIGAFGGLIGLAAGGILFSEPIVGAVTGIIIGIAFSIIIRTSEN